MDKMNIKPASGMRVRFPDTPSRLLPEEGATVPRSAYWLRRLAKGDVLKFSKSNAAAKPATTTTKSAKNKQGSLIDDDRND